MSVRAELERREREHLAPYACLSSESRGRAQPEAEHEYRTCFQRDRDRIIHTKAFRRLKGKTQVFLSPEGDHYRTRLTHTLEVSQIARTMARALCLNEDLTEAICMGHDLGHTPFGHAGEMVLNEKLEGGFRHFEQSLRIVDRLEETSRGPGLNLTQEVRDGIVHHSMGKCILFKRDGAKAATLEGQVVSIADAIAYVNHDIDDAIRAGVITLDDLPQDAVGVLGRTSSRRINAMAGAVIAASGQGTIAMAEEVREATVALRAFLYTSVYPCDRIDAEVRKGKKILRELYDYLLEHPTPDSLDGDPSESNARRTADFVAGMTDAFALHLYERTFFPVPWPA